MKNKKRFKMNFLKLKEKIAVNMNILFVGAKHLNLILINYSARERRSCP